MSNQTQPLQAAIVKPPGICAPQGVSQRTPITVSLYLKPAGGTRVLADRASMLAARVTEHGDNMTAVSDFAANHQLAIAGSDPARRLVRLTGPASAMEQAFGTELSHYEGGGQT